MAGIICAERPDLDGGQGRPSPAGQNGSLETATYPAHLLRQRRLADGRTVVVRPVRPADEAAEREFFAALSAETLRLRFQRFAGAPTPELIRFYTHVDYDRHMAFVCEFEGRIVGDARYAGVPGTRACELGIVVADDWRHTGVAQLLMDALLRAAQARGFETMEGVVLAENRDMLDFARELGFEAEPLSYEPALVRVRKKL